MTTICHHCRQPLTPADTHDLKVMRPVHKACHIARLADPPTKHLQIKRMPLPASVARTLPRWGRGQ